MTAGLDAERANQVAAAREFRAAQTALARQIQRETATAPVMFEGSGVDEVLLVRGSTKTPASPVPRRFLEALAGPQPMSIRSGSGRRELAEIIASDQNPLTARVIVNRVWHHLFGRGIVPTVDNFGVLGQGPSHPELLDWLAVHFTKDLGWSIKSLVRELMLSRAYQMSSRPDDLRAEQLDPENVLLHRAHLRRLEGEAIRDAMLMVSGRFNAAAGGPSVPVHLTEFMEGRGRPQGGPLDGDGRRSLYIAVRRNFLPPFMLAFDTPIPFNTMGRRNVSNVPAQALFLMNDPLVVDLSRKWAQRILQERGRSGDSGRSDVSRRVQPAAGRGRVGGGAGISGQPEAPVRPAAGSRARRRACLGRPGPRLVQCQGIHLHPVIQSRPLMNYPCERSHQPLSRRDLLLRSANGFGALALAALLADDSRGEFSSGAASPKFNPLAPRPSHYAPRARSVIFLYMDGGPSQVDTFDPKPRLQAESGQAVQDEDGADAVQQQRQHAWLAVEIPAVRPERHSGQRLVSARRAVRGRPGRHSLDDQQLLRAHQCQLLSAHRQRSPGTAQHGGLDQLRPGQRIRRSAGVRRAQRRPDSARRTRQLQQRLSASHLPGLDVQAGRIAPWPI